jgi:ADP-ribosylglycohydrolase
LAVVPLEDFRPPSLAGPKTVNLAVSPCGSTRLPTLLRKIESAMLLVERSAIVTHDHPEAVRGAQAVVMTIQSALQGQSRDQIPQAIEQKFGDDLGETVDSIQSWYAFDVSCRGTVPPAIICALEATDFEDALRNAVSIGGDTDTLACITGGIAEALFGIPDWIAEEALARLDNDLRDVVERLRAVYPNTSHTTPVSVR